MLKDLHRESFNFEIINDDALKSGEIVVNKNWLGSNGDKIISNLSAIDERLQNVFKIINDNVLKSFDLLNIIGEGATGTVSV